MLIIAKYPSAHTVEANLKGNRHFLREQGWAFSICQLVATPSYKDFFSSNSAFISTTTSSACYARDSRMDDTEFLPSRIIPLLRKRLLKRKINQLIPPEG